MPRDRYRGRTPSRSATRWPGFPAACVELALLASFARPGGNATDIHLLNTTPARCHQRCNQRPAPGRTGVHSRAHHRAEPHTGKRWKRLGEPGVAQEDLKSGRPTGILDASVKLTPRRIS